MSFILRCVRPVNIQNWVAANAPGSLKSKPQESWKAYLAANSGTGQTISEMEFNFLKGQAAAGNTLSDKWHNYLSAQGGNKGREKARNKYK